MKGFYVLLAAAGVCAGVAQADTVTLTREDVASARDIQWAIYRATHFGTLPGKVIFDGRKGEFAVPGSRLNIEIPVSNLTVTGINGAAITTCTRAINFSDPQVKNIVVEGMRFDCHEKYDLHSGVFAVGVSDVTIRNNVFEFGDDVRNMEGLGIYVRDGSGWKIHDNVINSRNYDAEPASSVEFVGVTNSEIIGNTMKGIYGVTLSGYGGTPASSSNKVIANRIVAEETGIRLWEAARNTVMLNQIRLTAPGEVTGIYLDSRSSRNNVLFNRASSTTGAAVTGVLDQGNGNKVFGNQP